MRILFIEDDKELASAVCVGLEKEEYTVDYACNSDEGLYYTENSFYDLILLDRMLPGIDGITLLKKIRQKGITTPVLILTALGDISDKVDGLDAGADDYLAKPFDMRELFARIRALIRRPAQITEDDFLTFSDITMETHSLLLNGNKSSCTLSKKEAELLRIFISNAEKTINRQPLFAAVWGVDSDAMESNLDIYIHFLRRRLNAVSSNVKIVTVRGIGYRLESDNA